MDLVFPDHFMLCNELARNSWGCSVATVSLEEALFEEGGGCSLYQLHEL